MTLTTDSESPNSFTQISCTIIEGELPGQVGRVGLVHPSRESLPVNESSFFPMIHISNAELSLRDDQVYVVRLSALLQALQLHVLSSPHPIRSNTLFSMLSAHDFLATTTHIFATTRCAFPTPEDITLLCSKLNNSSTF